MIAGERFADVVLLDLMLPHVDGFELLTRIRENPVGATCPVLVLSAKALEGDIVQKIAAGGRSYNVGSRAAAKPGVPPRSAPTPVAQRPGRRRGSTRTRLRRDACGILMPPWRREVGPMAKGSCLCGGITYEATTVGPNVTKCHCKICQKTSGSACGDYTTAPIDGFKWTRGETLLTKYESSPGNFRNFCSVCGTHLPTGHPAMGIYFIQPGTLDSAEPLVESAHMFLKSAAGWHQRIAGLAEFQEYPG